MDTVTPGDALEQAWAELARQEDRTTFAINELEYIRAGYVEERARAERAEAALARVRALCDWAFEQNVVVSPVSIRGALEGTDK